MDLEEADPGGDAFLELPRAHEGQFVKRLRSRNVSDPLILGQRFMTMDMRLTLACPRQR